MKIFRKKTKQNFTSQAPAATERKATSSYLLKTNATPNKKKNRRKFSTAPIARFAWFLVGIFVIVAAGFSFFLPIFKSATALDYFDYVSELRSNILVAESNEYLLKVYAIEKEYPYSADGIKRETSTRAEIFFSAPTGDKSCRISFSLDGKTYDSEASYDNVKAEYFLSEPADFSSVKSLEFTIRYGDENLLLTAKSVKTDKTLSPRQVLTKLKENAPSVFENLTYDKKFVGEIYLRLICEDAPYYYIGLIEKSGKVQAYLLHSESGKILAKREHGI